MHKLTKGVYISLRYCTVDCLLLSPDIYIFSLYSEAKNKYLNRDLRCAQCEGVKFLISD